MRAQIEFEEMKLTLVVVVVVVVLVVVKREYRVNVVNVCNLKGCIR